VGRRTAEGRIGNTVEAFDEPTRQKRSALWVAPRRQTGHCFLQCLERRSGHRGIDGPGSREGGGVGMTVASNV
jgi:hypothetical protein